MESQQYAGSSIPNTTGARGEINLTAGLCQFGNANPFMITETLVRATTFFPIFKS